jgi:polyisoprenyl-teichoic acid--peptidoglycan teichoic acid transferase
MSRTNARMVRPRSSSFDRVTLIVLIVFLIVAGITSVLAFRVARDFFVSTGVISVGDAPPVISGESANVSQTPGAATAEANSSSPTTPLQKANDPTPVPWDGTSRVTILIMGLDYRDWEAKEVPRTDTMILLSVDPLAKTAGILTIPRDMWVNIPGMNYNKINTAYRWGEVYNLPGGGPGLAMKTVEEFLGVPINYYAQIDFSAFVRFIDELGGLDMKIRKAIKVDPIGPGNTRTLEPGTQTLDGATVLAYARQRYTEGGDFDRSKRQLEVIMALRDQILNFNQLPMLISKSPKLYQELSSGIRTNLTLNQVIQLALLASKIDKANIKQGIIGPPKQVEFATNPEDGQAILIPVPDQIRILRDEVFATGGPVAPAAVQDSGDPSQLMKDEKARVIIKNGTSIAGLATKTSDLLRNDGMNIVGEDNAPQAVTNTTIYDYSGKPYTIKYLIEKLKVPNSRIVNRFDPNAQQDIEIVLGDDWGAQNK